MSVHIPAVEKQTELRKATLFWITGLKEPRLLTPEDKRHRMAAWMVRSACNPDNPYWHGIEVDAPRGTDTGTELFRAAGRIIGIQPQFIDLVGVVQPGDHPNIHHTTFIHTACGRAPGDPNPRTLPRPTIGLTMGIFPLDGLPLDRMRPSEAALLPQILTDAVKNGLSPLRMEYAPSNAHPGMHTTS